MPSRAPAPAEPAATPSDDASYPAWRDMTPLEVLMSHGDTAHQPVVISALYGFESPLAHAWVERVFAARVARHPRFRAALAARGRPRFVPLPGLEHRPGAVPQGVVHLEAAADAGASAEARAAAFRARLDRLASVPLPTDRALWALHHFPGFAVDAPGTVGGSTLLLRIHHAVGDGVALVRFFFAEVADRREGGREARIRRPRREVEARVRVRVRARARAGFLAALMAAATRAGGALRDAAAIFLGPLVPDAETVFAAGPLGREKFLHFAPKIPLADVKVVSKKLGITVNAVLSACLTAALRGYLLQYGGSGALPSPLRFHAALAFNMHDLGGDEVTLSNKAMLIPMQMHVAEPNPEVRLRRVMEVTAALKAGHRPALGTVAFEMLKMIPDRIRKPLWRHMTKCTSVVWTNVPGPSEKVTVDGLTVDSIAVAAPADGNCGLVFTFFSYAGQCSLCVSGDRSRVQHPDVLEAQFMEELRRLYSQCLDKGTVVT